MTAAALTQPTTGSRLVTDNMTSRGHVPDILLSQAPHKCTRFSFSAASGQDGRACISDSQRRLWHIWLASQPLAYRIAQRHLPVDFSFESL
jgi:hypothetical protein